MTDFTNEFDLHDSLDRSVAIATAADISAKIKDLQADLKWFSDGFRKLFHGGATETGAKGAMVKVNVPNLPKASLDTKVLEALFPVSEFPQYYKRDAGGKVKMTTKASAVTFSA